MTSSSERSSIGIWSPEAEGKIERRNRRGHVKRDFIFFREHGDAVRSDFVRGVAIARDAVGADDDGCHAAGFQEVADHVVRDEGEGNVVLMQLPGSEPRALQIRPRFGNQHFDSITALDSHSNHAERCADSTGGESAGVTLRHHAAGLGHELGAEAANSLVGFTAFLVEDSGLFNESRSESSESFWVVACGTGGEFIEAALESLDGPEQIDSGGTGARNRVANRGEFRAHLGESICLGALDAKGDTHRGGDTNCGSAANDHVFDGLGDVAIIGVRVIDNLGRAIAAGRA